MVRDFLFSPEPGQKEEEKGIDLQPSQDHQETEQSLGGIREMEIMSSGTHLCQSRSDISQTGNCGTH